MSANMANQKLKALVVGTGLGGLATALRLAKKGYQVSMVEKYHQAGGRLNQIRKDGFTFDMGPSFFSMSYEFEEFRQYCGIEMPFEFVELDPLYTVNFAHSDRRYVIHKDLAKLAEVFHEEGDFEAKMRSYLTQAARLFHDTEHIIIRKNFDTIAQFATALARVPKVHAPKLVRTVWQELSRRFETHEAKVILSLVAFFLGATPFDTPAIYSLLSYTEFWHDGYHNVKGGMYQIVKGMLRELDKEGVRIDYGVEIVDYVQLAGTLTGFVDQTGKLWTADLFVVNSDAAAFRGLVFGREKFSPKRLDAMEWTLAPFTMYLGVKGKIDSLDQHNYFLGENFKGYAAKIFKTSITPDKPYYYVNVLSRHNPDVAPEGCENLFVLCPVPDRRFKPDWSDREELADNIIDDLSARCGFDIKANLLTRTLMDPADWEKSFNLYRGSGLGLAHGIPQIGGFRPKNVDEVFPNVFYVGASTTPGTGLPMVIISSRLVMERVESYTALIPRPI